MQYNQNMKYRAKTLCFTHGGLIILNNDSNKLYKNTKQRNLILEVLEKAVQPLTADDIFIAVKPKYTSISLSTIYRNLEMLLQKDIITKETFNDNKARYELKRENHKHRLICKGCNIIVDIEECPLKALEDKLKSETHFDISDHKVEIYGLCPKCKNK